MKTKTIELALYRDTEYVIISARSTENEKYILGQPGFVRISESQTVTFNLIPYTINTDHRVDTIDIKLKDLGAQISALMDEKESILNENT